MESRAKKPTAQQIKCARHLPERVSQDEVEMKVLINLGKERERGAENKNAQRCGKTRAARSMCALSALSHVKPIVGAGKDHTVREKFGDRNDQYDRDDRGKH